MKGDFRVRFVYRPVRSRHRLFYRIASQVFNDDLSGPDGVSIEIDTAVNGSFEKLSGNFTLQYGANNTTRSLVFNATASEVEDALEVCEKAPLRLV